MADPTPPAVSPPPAESADPTRSLRATLRGIGSVVAPTSAVTALLYYFGWTRTTVQATRLGLDESLLGYSTQDYLLRSITSMLAPLVVGLIAILLGLALHAVLTAWIHRTGGRAEKSTADPVRRRLLARMVSTIAAAGLVLLALGGAGTRVARPSYELYVVTPVCVTLGLVLLVYAANLYRRFLIRPKLAEAADELHGLRVIAIEADLRRPEFRQYVGMTSGQGLSGILHGTASIMDELVTLDAETFEPSSDVTVDAGSIAVVPAGPLPANPQQALAQPRMRALIEAARSLADVVLVDTSPIGTVNDAAALTSLVDGVTFIVRLNHTTKDAARRALRLLSTVSAPQYDIVLTDAEDTERVDYYAPVPAV